MKYISSISLLWLKLVPIFTPVQKFFNGNFWEFFLQNFSRFVDNKTILDLACGPGDMCRYVRPKAYIGIDINSDYIAYANKKYSNPKINFKKGDITQGKLPRVDTIFLVSAAHHLSDRQMHKLIENVRNSQFKDFIIIDGFAQGVFASVLFWLDAVLGGGKYFRDEDQIASFLNGKLKITKKGRFKAEKSYYWYLYIIARKKKYEGHF